MNVLLQVVSDLHVLLKTVVTLESLGKIIPLIFRNNVQKEGVKRKKKKFSYLYVVLLDFTVSNRPLHIETNTCTS